jgi:hypothetical protein
MFMTAKVMVCVPVPDWKTGWEVSLIIEALKECYPLEALDNRATASPLDTILLKSNYRHAVVSQA